MTEGKSAKQGWIGLVFLTIAFSVVSYFGWQRFQGNRTTTPPDAWPRISAYELEVDLTEPARFRGSARVQFEDVPEGPLHFLFNRSLTIDRAEVEGRPVEVTHLHRLPARFHGEARLIRVAMDSPANGAVQLDFQFQGDAELGTEGSDWRGILYVGETEARMSEQTVFYPQIPVDLEGPAVQLAPFQLTVEAPLDWEVFAPLGQVAVESGSKGKRWRFAGDRPQELSIVAGVRQRSSTRVGGTEVVTLLRDEHADLADSFVEEAAAAMEQYSARFGAIDTGSLGIFEMSCRSASSYNWMSHGVMAIDRQALGREVPIKTLAHEVAHLWWGGACPATGAGERFLTEGMAEFSAWSYLEDLGRIELVQGAISNTQRRVAQLVESGDSAALASVGFGHEHYTDLAYGKGALVLRTLRGQLLPGVLDRALAQLITGSKGQPITLEDFQQAVRASSGLDALQVPWLHGAGDLDLELTQLEIDEDAGTAQLSIRATPATSHCTLDPRGTPVGVQLGGAGWSKRHTVVLTGEVTQARFQAESTVTYARLDPDSVWSRPPRIATVVIDGAELENSDPPAGGQVPFGGQSIRLTFDRALAPVELESLRAAQLSASSAEIHALAIWEVKFTDEGRTLELGTEPWVPERRYRVLLTPLADVGGTPLAQSSFEFETLKSDDRTAPRIIATEPPSGSTVGPGEIEVSVTFDETMHRGQGFPSRVVRANRGRDLEFPDFADFGTWDQGFRTITWTIPDPEPGKTYCMPFVGGTFRDLSGNGAADFELTFQMAEDLQQ